MQILPYTLHWCIASMNGRQPPHGAILGSNSAEQNLPGRRTPQESGKKPMIIPTNFVILLLAHFHTYPPIRQGVSRQFVHPPVGTSADPITRLPACSPVHSHGCRPASPLDCPSVRPHSMPTAGPPASFVAGAQGWMDRWRGLFPSERVVAPLSLLSSRKQYSSYDE